MASGHHGPVAVVEDAVEADVAERVNLPILNALFQLSVLETRQKKTTPCSVILQAKDVHSHYLSVAIINVNTSTSPRKVVGARMLDSSFFTDKTPHKALLA